MYNNYVGISSTMNNNFYKIKSFDILTISLRILHNYFGGPIKLFLDLYVIKLRYSKSIMYYFILCILLRYFFLGECEHLSIIYLLCHKK